LSTVAETALTAGVLLVGVYMVFVMEELVATRVAAATRSGAVAHLPLQRAAWALLRQQTWTERPDNVSWHMAPALYLGLAAAGLALVPLAPGWGADVPAGIVLWGGLEALTVVAVFLHGWSANSALALIAGYRFAAIGLSVMLLSMFVLIGTALPAESLNIEKIVESQRGAWNVVRQPLGLPLFLLLGLAISLRGPFDYANSADLAGGTTVEVSGPALLCWQLARAAMLVAFAAMASAVFLGGYLGPVLPGPLWVLVKTAGVLALLVSGGAILARPDASRMLTLIWVVLLPLAFLHLLIAGLQVL
jgi:NADH-quinone oxidoreductase subunit H